jgi:L-asparaginase/Glu-tRNA(Gln) amidotransferase subunit D
MRPVSILSAGGTIAMTGTGAAGVRPELDATGLVEGIPALAGLDLHARTLASAPSVTSPPPRRWRSRVPRRRRPKAAAASW